MRQAFFLTVLLLGVLAAMFVLQRKGQEGRAGGASGPVRVTGGPGGATGPAGSSGSRSATGPGGMRVVSLTRLLPSYALELPAAEPAALRQEVLRQLAVHGGSATGPLPLEPRAPFAVQVPHGAFKKLLRALGLGTRPLRLRPTGDKVHTGGPALLSLTVSLPAPDGGR